MLASLPFLRRLTLLDGTLPGDRGFDPFNFAADANSVYWQRRMEIKHARLAMLASAGWLSAELLHGPIGRALNLPVMLASGDRVPSILNDGLSHAAFSGVRLGGKTNNQKFFMQEAELFYGRLGMLAITGFAFQEFFLHSAVVDQMPFELMREMIL
jgi:hypothetical protein